MMGFGKPGNRGFVLEGMDLSQVFFAGSVFIGGSREAGRGEA